MESVESTSSVVPLMVTFHFDRWRISLKNRPSGSSGLTSISPLGFETRNVEPSRMLILLPLIENSPPLWDGCPTAFCVRHSCAAGAVAHINSILDAFKQAKAGC